MASLLQTMRAGGTEHPESIMNFLTSRLVTVAGIFDISGTQFKVAEETVPAMSVKVQQGYAFIPKSDLSMVYPIQLITADGSVAIVANSSGSTRNDAIVLYIDLSASPSATISNVAKLVAVAGTPGGAAPTNGDIETSIGASNPFIRLANVEVVSGATSIVTAKITDTRVAVTYSPNVAGYQSGSQIYAADAGANDTYVITLSPVPTTYTTGMVIHFKANTVNTGAATLNVNGLGAKTIKKSYNLDLDNSDIKANQLVSVIYDGTNFQLLSQTTNYISLLKANSGTDTTSSAALLDTIAISGLTAKDTLKVIINSDTIIQQTASISLYNSTDSVQITDTNTIAAGKTFITEVNIRQMQNANTAVLAIGAVQEDDTFHNVGTNSPVAFTTAWTGSWTLALRHNGVTSGGTFRWSWSVYKISGQ